MNDLEWYALIFCVSAIVVAVIFTWLWGSPGCCANCEQGRRCRCQQRKSDVNSR